MKPANRKLVLLGYGCAVLPLFIGNNGVEIFIGIALGVAGVCFGITAASGGRRINGTVIIILSVLFAYLSATGFRQGFVDSYQAARQQQQP